jgi:SAM-dependent methyltransferase
MHATSKINWKTTQYVKIAGHLIASALSESTISPTDGGHGRLYWKLRKLRDDFLVDGFIEREIGKLIREYSDEKAVFVEVGCGDMSLHRYLPASLYYNAFDIALNPYHVAEVMRTNAHANLAFASAADIPMDNEVASIIVSTECFEHIRDIDTAVQEIYRVAKPGAYLICSIPNNYGYKYRRKGPHPGHVNSWSFTGFVEFMRKFHFEFIRGFMKGWWIPLRTRASYQLPLHSRAEAYNTNFFFVFKKAKKI